jgi:Na+/H+ antiporter NhaC
MILINYTINTKAKRKIYGIVGAFLSLIIPFFFMLNNQDNHLERSQSLCPFKMLTGFPCPGCGITKSLVYFYQGDFEKSIYYHILGPFVIIFCVLIILLLTVELITKKEYFDALFFNKKLAYGLGLFLGFYHFIRIVVFIYHNSLDDILKQSIWQ